MKTTSIELPAEDVAKLRAMLRALGSKRTAESLIAEQVASTVADEPLMGYLGETVHPNRWDGHPKRKEMEAKLVRCRDGDRRLVRPEPSARNARVHDRYLSRIKDLAAKDDIGPGLVLNQLVRAGLDVHDRGWLKPVEG